MKGPDQQSDRLKAALIGAVWGAGVGVACLLLPLGSGLESLSYELPFLLRPDLQVSNVALIYMDRASHVSLAQPSDRGWDRALHARLIDRLAADGAKAVVFDVRFDQPSANDAPFLEAVQRARQAGMAVVVGADLEDATRPGKLQGSRVVTPFTPLDRLAAWGVVEHGLPGRVLRCHFPGAVGEPSLAWRVAQLTGATALPEPSAPRWINYYGPPGTVPSYSYQDVVTNRFRPGFFSNQVLFVGCPVGMLRFTGGRQSDEWPTPHTRLSGRWSSGVEINATVYLNLMRGDWLQRLPAWAEWLGVVVVGLALGGGLVWMRPRTAAALVVLVATFLTALATWSLERWHLWFAWMIPAAAQAPVALAWAVVYRVRQGVAAAKLTRGGTLVIPAAEGGGPAPAVSDHKLVRCIGRGAYGEVWLAQDVLGHFHAAKIVYRNRFTSEEPYLRELNGIREYWPISRSHPGWVDVLHVGCNHAAGYFFYIMELGDDETRGQCVCPESYSPKNLAKELKKRGRLSLAETVELGLALSAALEHLHRHRLIHRDIKPSNVIFVNGVPKFADIGLVTEMESTGHKVSILGTPGYMPPEGPGTPAADVFALGRLLYQACSGRPLEDFPELPTAADPAEQEAWAQFKLILLKACAEEKPARYQSAADLHAELLRLRERLGLKANAAPAAPA